MTITSSLMTAEELYALGDPGVPSELVRGERRMMTPASYDHGRVEIRLTTLLAQYLGQRPTGELAPSDTGFLLSRAPDTVRCADLAFICQERSDPPGRQGPFYPGAPDLAVEITSPSDRAGEIDEKVQDWLNHGCQVVWLVNPKWRTVTVYRGSTDIKVLTEVDTLSEPALLPGLELPVGQIFEVRR